MGCAGLRDMSGDARAAPLPTWSSGHAPGPRPLPGESCTKEVVQNSARLRPAGVVTLGFAKNVSTPTEDFRSDAGVVRDFGEIFGRQVIA